MSSEKRTSVLSGDHLFTVDGGWGWAVVFSTFMIHVISEGFVFTFGIFYVEFLTYFQATSSAEISTVMAIFVGTRYCVGPIASSLINIYGCKTVSILGVTITSIGLLLSQVVPSHEYLYFTIGILAGSGFGLTFLPTIVSIACHFEHKRATAMGLSMAGSGIGTLIFAPLMDWLIDYYGSWKGALLIATGLVLNGLVFSAFYRQYGAVLIKRKSETTLEQTDANVEQATNPANIPAASTSRTSLIDVATESPQVHNRPARNRFDSSSSKVYCGLMNKIGTLYDGTIKTGLVWALHPVSATVLSCAGIRQKKCFFRFLETFREEMDLSLFKNYVFLIFAFCNFLTYFGINSPIVFVYHRSKMLGIATGTKASLFNSIIGISNTLGKIVTGIFADRVTTRRLYIYNFNLMINGIATVLTSMITEYYQMAIYCAIFGFTWGSCVCLSSIILVEFLGMDRLNNAYGFLLLDFGIATSIGTPITGYLMDLTGSYDVGFYLCGTTITASSIILFTIPIVHKKYPQ